jgi:NTE family protein
MSAGDGARTHKLALVIGSGSVMCAAALGVQRVLKREGIDLDILVGCSGGALYAAAAGLGWTVDHTIDSTLRLWNKEATSKKNRRALLRAMMPRLFGFDAAWGMRDDGPILQRLQEAFGDTTFDDASTRLFITATDFANGEQVVLSEGLIRDAIRASISIPFVLPPYRIGDKLLVDGYLSDPLPVNVAMREGADVILALGFESNYQRRVTTPARFAFQVSAIMTNNLLRSRYAFHNASHHSEIIAIVPEFNRRIGLFATSQIPYVIEEGERTAEKHVPYIKRLLEAGG